MTLLIFPLFLTQIPSCPRVHLEISRQRTPATLRLDGPETPSASDEEVDYLEEIEDEPVQVVAFLYAILCMMPNASNKDISDIGRGYC